jgi:hypothetical protein
MVSFYDIIISFFYLSPLLLIEKLYHSLTGMSNTACDNMNYIFIFIKKEKLASSEYIWYNSFKHNRYSV